MLAKKGRYNGETLVLDRKPHTNGKVILKKLEALDENTCRYYNLDLFFY